MFRWLRKFKPDVCIRVRDDPHELHLDHRDAASLEHRIGIFRANRDMIHPDGRGMVSIGDDGDVHALPFFHVNLILSLLHDAAFADHFAFSVFVQLNAMIFFRGRQLVICRFPGGVMG